MKRKYLLNMRKLSFGNNFMILILLKNKLS